MEPSPMAPCSTLQRALCLGSAAEDADDRRWRSSRSLGLVLPAACLAAPKIQMAVVCMFWRRGAAAACGRPLQHTRGLASMQARL
eukprot:jgi/Ulvmu1/8733/UM047_0074.1